MQPWQPSGLETSRRFHLKLKTTFKHRPSIGESYLPCWSWLKLAPNAVPVLGSSQNAYRMFVLCVNGENETSKLLHFWEES